MPYNLKDEYIFQTFRPCQIKPLFRQHFYTLSLQLESFSWSCTIICKEFFVNPSFKCKCMIFVFFFRKYPQILELEKEIRNELVNVCVSRGSYSISWKSSMPPTGESYLYIPTSKCPLPPQRKVYLPSLTKFLDFQGFVNNSSFFFGKKYRKMFTF